MVDGEMPRPLTDLWELNQNISERRLLEQYHDALEAREEAMRAFRRRCRFPTDGASAGWHLPRVV